jgi:hypothetical protein
MDPDDSFNQLNRNNSKSQYQRESYKHFGTTKSGQGYPTDEDQIDNSSIDTKTNGL